MSPRGRRLLAILPLLAACSPDEKVADPGDTGPSASTQTTVTTVSGTLTAHLLVDAPAS